MARSTRNLLDQIEEGALDSKAPLADVLRKCVALGGRAGSTELREWARRELDGYKPVDELPDYRRVSAVILIDGSNYSHRWTGQQIPPSALPDFVRDTIDQEAPLMQGVGELEQLVRSRQEAIKLQHQGMPDLVRYMNDTMNLNGTIHSMYWSISPNSIHGVVDTIRTTLTALVAELRAVGVEEIPSAEAADQAVNVVVHNAKRSTITVNTNQGTAHDSGGAQVIATSAQPELESRLPTWVRGPWGAAVGAATIVAGISGVAVWVGWNPFQ